MMSAGEQPMTYSDVDALAGDRYRSSEFVTTTERVFALLVDVADRYVSLLEEAPAAQVHPAPYVGWCTPMTAALEGLRQNLEMKRDGRIQQHR